jgi:hypothetical protein
MQLFFFGLGFGFGFGFVFLRGMWANQEALLGLGVCYNNR